MAGCSCGGNTKLIYSCAGAADVGKLSYEACQKVSKSGKGSMSCLSGIGADLSGFIESAKSACKNVVVDGCPVSCAKKIMEKKGVTNFEHILITDHDFKKGDTKITDENVDKVCKIIEGVL